MRRWLGGLALAAAAAAAGCIPLPHVVTDSPRIVGELRRGDGSPAAGVQVVVSHRNGDTLCAVPALRTTTGADGRFELPRASHRSNVLPLVDMYGTAVNLCVAREHGLAPAHDLPWSPTATGILYLTCVERAPPDSAAAGRTVACTERVEWTEKRPAPRRDSTSVSPRAGVGESTRVPAGAAEATDRDRVRGG